MYIKMYISKFMARRKLEDKNTRKILKRGDSYTIALPIDMVRELKWREKQKVKVKKSGQKIIIEDWKK
jgi:antitoxin component of MazEF toxin-antitoxin module